MSSKIIWFNALIIFHSVFSMESLIEKFNSWAITKKAHLSPAQKEWLFYKKLPPRGKPLIIIFKRLQKQFRIPFDLLKFIIALIIMDKNFNGLVDHEEEHCDYQIYLSLLHYLIHCNILKNECIEAVTKMYVHNLNSLDSRYSLDNFKWLQYKIIQPLLLPYSYTYLSNIQKSIRNWDKKALKKICTQPCIPEKALWNYAFLFTCNLQSGTPAGKKYLKNLLKYLVKYADPIQNFDLEFAYRCCPMYENQSLYAWLRDVSPYMSQRDNLNHRILPHLCMNKLKAHKTNST